MVKRTFSSGFLLSATLKWLRYLIPQLGFVCTLIQINLAARLVVVSERADNWAHTTLYLNAECQGLQLTALMCFCWQSKLVLHCASYANCQAGTWCFDIVKREGSREGLWRDAVYTLYFSVGIFKKSPVKKDCVSYSQSQHLPSFAMD